jgi:predicted MFS family arabinose efflux permease
MMFLAEAHNRQLSTFAVGVVLAASGAGGAVGSVVAKRLPGWVRKNWLQIQMCAWSFALGVLALTGMEFSWFMAIAMLILGLTGSIGNIEFSMFLVLTLRNDGMEHLLGRITGVGQALVLVASGVGPFLGGAAIQNLGLQPAVGVFFGLMFVVTVRALLVPVMSSMRGIRRWTGNSVCLENSRP